MDSNKLRAMWRDAGGSFHGPNIETGTMPESKLLPLLARLAAAERDAARYRWLRELPNADRMGLRFMGCDLDTVIDHAPTGVQK